MVSYEAIASWLNSLSTQSVLYRCWISEYEVVPDLDANADAVAIEHITLENEGWERDQSVKEPVEPSFEKP